MSKLKNKEEFEGGLEKRKGKGGKRRKKVMKHTLKYHYEALMTANKIHKNREELERGEFLWLARIYAPPGRKLIPQIGTFSVGESTSVMLHYVNSGQE